MHTVEPDSAVWCTLRNLTPRYDTHCGVDATVGCTPQSFFEIFCFPDSTVCCKPRTCTPWSFFKIHIQYLGEIETEFENTSSRLSESQMGSNHYKIEVENLVELSILSRQLLVPSSATKYVFTAQETLTLPGGSWVLPYSVCVWGGGGRIWRHLAWWGASKVFAFSSSLPGYWWISPAKEVGLSKFVIRHHTYTEDGVYFKGIT